VNTPIGKGDYGELMIAADLLRRGFRVAKPITHESRYDLIAVDGTNFYRVQCKLSSSAKGVLVVKCRRTGKHKQTRYTQTDIEWLAAFDLTTGVCYYLPSSLLGPDGRTEIVIRLKKSKNSQSKKTHWHTDFLAPPISTFKVPSEKN
jgi:PD-(D/E)XK endonuclease